MLAFDSDDSKKLLKPKANFSDPEAWRLFIVHGCLNFFGKQVLSKKGISVDPLFEQFEKSLNNLEGFSRVLFQSSVAAMFRTTLIVLIPEEEISEKGSEFFVYFIKILEDFSRKTAEDETRFTKWRSLYLYDPWKLDIDRTHIVTFGQFIAFYPEYEKMHGSKSNDFYIWKSTPPIEERRVIFKKQLIMDEAILYGDLGYLSWGLLKEIYCVDYLDSEEDR